MGCHGWRGMSCALCALLLGALAWASPAGANTIAVGDVQVGEAGSATFTVTRDASLLSGSTTVAFRTVDGSAGSGADYVGANGTLTFQSAVFGATQRQQVAIAIKGDLLDEVNETFRLAIAGSEVPGGEATATATIVDDDPKPALSVSDGGTVTEAAGAKASFVVRLSRPSGRSVAVAYTTANGSATAGQDYAAQADTVRLPAGSTEARIDVGVLDDAIDEPAETFALKLTSSDTATIDDGEGTATIADDDEPPAAPAAAPASTAPSPPSGTAGQAGAPGATTGSSTAGTSLGLSAPRLKRPSTVLVTLSCPQAAGTCSGRVTIFSIPNRRSRVRALRKERKLGRVSFSVQGGRAQTLSLKLGRTDAGLLRRTGRMRVRAYALTQDASGRAGVRSVSGTLIARTAHSGSSRD